jgi:hypothetical protein
VKYSLLAFFVLFSFLSSAQDLNGFWKGSLDMRSGCFPVNNMEVQLTIKDGVVSGSSYHFLDIDNYVKKRIAGRYDKASKHIIIQETAVTTYKIPVSCQICIKVYDLTYSRRGNQEILSGNWGGKIQGTGTDCSTGPVTLYRTKESAFKEIPEVLVDTGELKLDFYDNAQIDGDSITVLVNGVVKLSTQVLGIKPVTVKVRIDLKNPFQEIEMRAENEGDIPPNTAVLIVTAGTQRYQLFLTSTETKSAKVRFVYDETERGRAGNVKELR